jgi:hypothetical protein
MKSQSAWPESGSALQLDFSKPECRMARQLPEILLAEFLDCHVSARMDS